MRRTAWRTRVGWWAAAAGILLLLLGLPASASDDNIRKFATGTLEEGSLTLPLHRGGSPPVEQLVAATTDCDAHLTLRITWSKSENVVNVHLVGKGVLEPFPTVLRQVGVNWLPNPFVTETKDVVNGRYQLWIVGGGGPMVTFYFDRTTLNLKGSELDFATPPANSVTLKFPTSYLIGSPMFQPDAKGDVNLHWTFPYDGAVRGDRPELAHFFTTIPPPNLCLVHPVRLDLSTLRPYFSKPLRAAQARPWSDYLRGGLIFDVTVEPPQYFSEPPTLTRIGTYSGATVIPGSVPPSWMLDIDAAFMNLAPPIRPWPGRTQGCVNHWEGLHSKNINFCQSSPQGGTNNAAQ
jgi:hypothetical protein